MGSSRPGLPSAAPTRDLQTPREEAGREPGTSQSRHPAESSHALVLACTRFVRRPTSDPTDP